MQRMMVVLFAVLALAACSKQAPEVAANDQVPADQRTEAASDGASEPAGGGGEAATWVAVDIDFSEAPSEATTGSEIVLENQGQSVHNVTIDGNVIVEAQPGQTATAALELDPGTYDFVCSVPGHEKLMKGKVEVVK